MASFLKTDFFVLFGVTESFRNTTVSSGDLCDKFFRVLASCMGLVNTMGLVYI